MAKLTDSMVRMLRDVETFGDPYFSVKGKSKKGGAGATLLALRRRELVKLGPTNHHGGWGYQLTQAGTDALTAREPENTRRRSDDAT